ncbi:MAG: hypothetical protein LBL92_07515 [Propionibacteriaceae bacterium]|jgi:hypothetical protein|nr:hypothetical protein [Propionibacteriaceae bacterium]
MSRRVNLPGASELFRGTGTPPAKTKSTTSRTTKSQTSDADRPVAASGRVRHDEKITVYVSADELIALEQARLILRKGGVVVDRGRLVRGAIASALDDLQARGLKADIVQRLGDL